MQAKTDPWLHQVHASNILKKSTRADGLNQRLERSCAKTHARTHARTLASTLASTHRQTDTDTDSDTDSDSYGHARYREKGPWPEIDASTRRCNRRFRWSNLQLSTLLSQVARGPANVSSTSLICGHFPARRTAGYTHVYAHSHPRSHTPQRTHNSVDTHITHIQANEMEYGHACTPVRHE